MNKCLISVRTAILNSLYECCKICVTNHRKQLQNFKWKCVAADHEAEKVVFERTSVRSRHPVSTCRMHASTFMTCVKHHPHLGPFYITICLLNVAKIGDVFKRRKDSPVCCVSPRDSLHIGTAHCLFRRESCRES
jgi:hypothetical protein